MFKLKPQASTFWVDDLTWACGRHIPSSLKYPWSMETCRTCKSQRPELSLRPPPPPDKPIELKPVEPQQGATVLPFRLPAKKRCAWPPCDQEHKDNSPYCSKVCSDRCGRVRRKVQKGPGYYTPEDQVAYQQIQATLSLFVQKED